MKIGISVILSFICMVFLTVNCKKITCDICDSDSSFALGRINNYINVYSFESPVQILSDWHDDIQYQLDINNDGVMDFNLISSYMASPGGANIKECSIEVLNTTIQISIKYITDTTYKCIERINDDIISIHYYNNNSSYSCSSNGIDTITDITVEPYPRIYQEGDTIDFNELWLKANLTLSSLNSSVTGFEYPTYYSIYRGNWNDVGIQYILFRMFKNYKSYYGWLKLSVTGHGNIHLYEYACQKEN